MTSLTHVCSSFPRHLSQAFQLTRQLLSASSKNLEIEIKAIWKTKKKSAFSWTGCNNIVGETTALL